MSMSAILTLGPCREKQGGKEVIKMKEIYILGLVIVGELVWVLTLLWLIESHLRDLILKK